MLGGRSSYEDDKIMTSTLDCLVKIKGEVTSKDVLNSKLGKLILTSSMKIEEVDDKCSDDYQGSC
jgi:hypothetical protein